jgi:hypothetical protein
MRRTSAILLIALAATAVLAGCTSATDRAIDAVESVTYSQTFAVADFDEGEYVMKGDDLASLLDLMRRYAIDPATYAGGGVPCPDSIRSEVTIAFDDGTADHSFTMTGCEPETFPVDAGVLLINYTSEALTRENGYGSIGYAQYQAVPGFDDREYSQDIPEEIARFVALLEEYDIDPDGYVSLADPGCTGGVSMVVSLFNTSDLAPHVIARMEFEDCGRTGNFDHDATTLVSEWREATH